MLGIRELTLLPVSMFEPLTFTLPRVNSAIFVRNRFADGLA